MNNTIPLAPIKRLMNEAGCKRISDDATELMVKVAENFISEVARDAGDAANHAGRTTVRVEDIEFVI